MLGGKPLEQRVGVRRVADLERPELGVVADAVEDETPRAPRIATKLASVSISSRGSA